MKFYRVWLIFALAFCSGPVFADSTGQVLQIHNQTGHKVAVFLFADGKIHTNANGGVQIATLENGGSFNANIKANPFSIMLEDQTDVWHVEFHDRVATDITFTKDTGHERKN
jgi:hypothetical protein